MHDRNSLITLATKNGNGNGNHNGNGHTNGKNKRLDRTSPFEFYALINNVEWYHFCDLIIGKVSMADIFFDDSYQRVDGFRRRQANAIASEWDPRIAGFIPVFPRRNGIFAAPDFMHRYRALASLHPTMNNDDGSPIMLPAILFEYTTKNQAAQIAEEANVFAKRNSNVKPITPRQNFKARYCAGKPEERDIVKIVTEHGARITFDGTNPPNIIRNVGALRNAYEELGHDKFDFFMNIISQYRAPDDMTMIQPAARKANFINGLTPFVKDNESPQKRVLQGLRNGWAADEIINHANQSLDGTETKGGRAWYRAVKTAIGESVGVGLAKMSR